MVEKIAEYEVSDLSDKEIELAPEADATKLHLDKQLKELNRVQAETEIITQKNHLTGFLQHNGFDKVKFQEQYHQYQAMGYAINPTDAPFQSFIGKSKQNIGDKQEKSRKQKRRELKQQRQEQGEAAGDFKGPWAAYKGQEISDTKTNEAQMSKEQLEVIKKYEAERQERIKATQEHNAEGGNNNNGGVGNNQSSGFQATSIYHGNPQMMMGGGSGGGYGTASRSFIEAPSYLRPKEHDCFIPKKWLHTWQGHDKGVQRVRFFPKTGHLMLSASHDGTCKIWDVLTHRKCIRSYQGHTKAIKDVCFTSDGRKFLSAGFDRLIQLWDTETGKVIRSFQHKKTPYCVRFHPSEERQNVFLAGFSHRKILQFDINAKEIVQSYEEHMGSIDSVTFIEHGKKFVSTSDDKKIFVWEFGIPVVAKHISEPDMHAVPATCLHPNGKYMAGQSMDNQIKVYDVKHGDFKLNRKKFFSGHLNSGYACGVRFSPDGQFLCSGDADGKLWFWNWKTQRNYRVMSVHENNVTIDCDWHPVEPSKVITCSWDGTIKLWD